MAATAAKQRGIFGESFLHPLARLPVFREQL